MQREIKYKAWDKKQKAFINGFNMIGYSTGQGAPKRKLQRFGTYWDEEDVVLMQYTGLKDKNGKEIYEGDIVKGTSSMNIYKVVYNQGCFKIANITHTSANLDLVGYNTDYIEVIGNIHDNPELVQEVSHG